MSKIINRAFRGFRSLCVNHRGYFSLRSGVRRYTPPTFSYPSTCELWRQDWSNIASDFRRSIDRLELCRA